MIYPMVVLSAAFLILLGLMLVKKIDDAAHHFAASVIAGRLGDGNYLNFVFG